MELTELPYRNGAVNVEAAIGEPEIGQSRLELHPPDEGSGDLGTATADHLGKFHPRPLQLHVEVEIRLGKPRPNAG